MVADVPRVPVAERGERPHRKRAAVLLLPPRVRVGVLASAGRGRLPEVPGGAAVVVLAQVGRVPRVRVPHDRLTTERNRCRPRHRTFPDTNNSHRPEETGTILRTPSGTLPTHVAPRTI